MGMDERVPTRPGTLTRERIAAIALKQAARHERAGLACLAELRGTGQPTGSLTEEIYRRAHRHARRGVDLAQTAMRLNQDRRAAPLLAAVLERQERTLRQIEDWSLASGLAPLPLAG